MDAAQVPLCGLRVAQRWYGRLAQGLRWQGARLALVAALVVAAWLRWPVLTANPFHEDEALYSTWALRIADGTDPWLEGVLVDKPPFLPYLLAGLFRVFGPSEVVARLPGFVAGVASVWCLYALARRLYGAAEAILAAWLLAFSPLHISLSGTAFTDSPLVFWGLGAAWAAVAGLPLMAGILLGLAVSTKQHGWLFVPLVLALVWLCPGPAGRDEASRARRNRPRLVPVLPSAGLLSLHAMPGAGTWPARTRVLTLALGFALPMGLTTWWDAHRWSFRPSYLDRSLTAYGGLAPVAWDMLPGRARAWTHLAGYLGASLASNLMLAAGAVLVFALATSRARSHARGRRLEGWVDLAWLGFGMGYLLTHVVCNFQPWDRYLLPLAPVGSLLMARGLASLARGFAPDAARRRWWVWGLLGVAVLVAWARPASLAAQSRLPLGADHGAYDGMRSAAAWVAEHVGPEEAVFHRWLGWHLGYYLYGTPIDHIWYPDAETLAKLAIRRGGGYLVAPSWHALRAERVALARAGYRLEAIVRAWGRVPTCTITVYGIRAGAPEGLAPAGGPLW